MVIPPGLVKAVGKGECVLFLGAGIHSGPPADSTMDYPKEHRPLSAKDLAEKLALLAQESPDPDPDFRLLKEYEGDLQKISFYVELNRTLLRATLVDTLQEHLQTGKEPSPALRILAELPFRIIVTTNYDTLLETALGDAGKTPQVSVYNPERKTAKKMPSLQDLTPNKPLVFKIHGSLEDRSSIVITDEDYIRFVQRMGDPSRIHPVPSTVRAAITLYSTLFIGYSLRDYNLRLLFRTLRDRLDKSDVQPSYSLDIKPDPITLRHWTDKPGYVSFLVENFWKFLPDLEKRVRNAEAKTS